MSLWLQSRRVGDVSVVTCTGRLVGGEEAAAFQGFVDSTIKRIESGTRTTARGSPR